MPDERNNSRMAELAFEMFGAKMASDFIADAWKYMGEATKTKIADEIGAQLIKNSFSGFTLDRLLGTETMKLITPIVEAHVNKHKDMIVSRAERDIEAVVAKQIDSLAHRAVEKALAEVKSQFSTRY